MATAVVAHPICAMVLPDEPMRVFAQRLSVCLKLGTFSVIFAYVAEELEDKYCALTYPVFVP